MSERVTGITPVKPTGTGQGLVVYGRETRTEMLKKFREHYQRVLDEATEMLALTDAQLVVTTYRGIWSREGEKVVEK